MAVVGAIFTAGSLCSEPSFAQATTPERAMDQVRYVLRDGESARFRSVIVNPNGSACGEVNAKNGFGGYSGFWPFAVTPDGRVIVQTRDSLAERYAVQGACIREAGETEGRAQARACEALSGLSTQNAIEHCWKRFAGEAEATRRARDLGVSLPPRPARRAEEPSQSALSTLERQRQQQPPSSPAGAVSSSSAHGIANSTAAERASIANKLGECWVTDAGAPNIQNIIVELRIEVDAGGTVRVVRPNGAIPTEPRARMVFEAARRALLDPRCNPLPLPPERLDALRNSVFRFNPRELGLR